MHCLNACAGVCHVQENMACILYGIMTEERVIREIRIDEAAGRGDSDSRMTCFEVIMPLKLQSTDQVCFMILDRY